MAIPREELLPKTRNPCTERLGEKEQNPTILDRLLKVVDKNTYVLDLPHLGARQTLINQDRRYVMRLLSVYHVIKDETFLVELLEIQLTLDGLKAAIHDRGKL